MSVAADDDDGRRTDPDGCARRAFLGAASRPPRAVRRPDVGSLADRLTPAGDDATRAAARLPPVLAVLVVLPAAPPAPCADGASAGARPGVAAQLRALGIADVEEAADAREALACVRRREAGGARPVDVLITRHALPGTLDGTTLAECLWLERLDPAASPLGLVFVADARPAPVVPSVGEPPRAQRDEPEPPAAANVPVALRLPCDLHALVDALHAALAERRE